MRKPLRFTNDIMSITLVVPIPIRWSESEASPTNRVRTMSDESDWVPLPDNLSRVRSLIKHWKDVKISKTK